MEKAGLWENRQLDRFEGCVFVPSFVSVTPVGYEEK